LLDVIEEERRYLELESAYTAALREAIDARTALLRALGVAS
jgi:outer membrane protein TolC